MPEPNPSPCLVCGKTLESVWTKEPDRRPADAVVFTTPGNYGSRVFDDEHGLLLEINVCDGCLIERHDRARLVRIKRTEQVGVYPWKPEATA